MTDDPQQVWADYYALPRKMNIPKVVVVLLAICATYAEAANVGSLHFGSVGKTGEYHSFSGWIEIDPKLDPDKIMIVLSSEHRTIVKWYPVKGQKEITLSFTLTDEDARTSRIEIRRAPTKNDGNSIRYEEIDLAKHLFISRKRAPNGSAKPPKAEQTGGAGLRPGV